MILRLVRTHIIIKSIFDKKEIMTLLCRVNTTVLPLSNAMQQHPCPCFRPFNPGLHPLPRTHNRHIRQPCTASLAARFEDVKSATGWAPIFNRVQWSAVNCSKYISASPVFHCMQLMRATPIAAFVWGSRTLVERHNKLILGFMPGPPLRNFKPTQHLRAAGLFVFNPSINKILNGSTNS